MEENPLTLTTKRSRQIFVQCVTTQFSVLFSSSKMCLIFEQRIFVVEYYFFQQIICILRTRFLKKHFQTSPCQAKQWFVSRLIWKFRETGGVLDRKSNRWSTVLREGTRKTQGSVSCNPSLNYWETSIIKFSLVSKRTPCIFLSRTLPKINTSYLTLATQMEPQDLWKKKTKTYLKAHIDFKTLCAVIWEK